MNFLKEKIEQVGMTPKQLAKKLDKNPVTVYRWVNEDRKISPEAAIEISKILRCDPAAILFPPKKLNVIQLHSYTDDSFMVKDLTKRYYQDVVIPGGFYTPETKAVKFYKIGSQHHEEILLFERYGTKNNYEGFHEDSINKICYLEPNLKKSKEGCAPIVALVKINENTLDDMGGLFGDGESQLNADPSLGPVTTLVGRLNNTSVTFSPVKQGLDTAHRRVPSTPDFIRETYACRLVQHDDIFKLVDDPFNKTKYSSPLTVMRDKRLDIYSDDTFITDKVRITYLKRTEIVDLGNQVNCDLQESTH